MSIAFPVSPASFDYTSMEPIIVFDHSTSSLAVARGMAIFEWLMTCEELERPSRRDWRRVRPWPRA